MTLPGLPGEQTVRMRDAGECRRAKAGAGALKYTLPAPGLWFLRLHFAILQMIK